MITLNKDITKISPKKIPSAFKLQDESYERLEILGDSVIRLILTGYLFARFKNENEGFITRLRTKMENGEVLAVLSKKIKINEYAIIARFYELQNSRHENIHILEDIMEAFMGALFLEAGYEICNDFFVNLIEHEMDISQLLYNETNHKDTLLQYHHVHKWCDPEYGMLEQFGTEKKMFKMFVNGNDNNIAGIGIGTSKKKGEQDAALKALIKYGAIKENDDDTDEEYFYD
jgi:dsRNA-specific ribonuclease